MDNVTRSAQGGVNEAECRSCEVTYLKYDLLDVSLR